eukprot:14233104-Ditylum_brightwellii.AAC.1
MAKLMVQVFSNGGQCNWGRHYTKVVVETAVDASGTTCTLFSFCVAVLCSEDYLLHGMVVKGVAWQRSNVYSNISQCNRVHNKGIVACGSVSDTIYGERISALSNKWHDRVHQEQCERNRYTKVGSYNNSTGIAGLALIWNKNLDSKKD